MEQKKDYYKILGLSEEDKKLPKEEFLKKLSKNYKKLAIQYHPDRNPGNKEAEDKFKEVNEANQVLSDYDGKKAEYDNPMSQFRFDGNMNMDDILRHFNMSFGSNFGFNPFDFGHQQMRQKGSNIRGTVRVTLEEILHGTDKTVRYTRKKVCHTCHGTGKDKYSKEEMCPHCHGLGVIMRSFGNMSIQSTCTHCNGTGIIVTNPCNTCGGSGLEDEVVEKTFKIPAGTMGGMTFNIQGAGNEIAGEGNIPGDLQVIVQEIPHETFIRDGIDLYLDVNVGVIDAILGTKARITTLDGKKLDINIPSGSEEGKQLVVNGYGLPEYTTDRIGRLICVIHIVMPKSLNKKEIKTLEKLSKSESFKNIC